jgi:hypothetical protein
MSTRVPRIQDCKLQDIVTQEEFGQQMKHYVPRDKVTELHEEWERFKKGMVRVNEEVCSRNSKRKTRGDPMAV